MWNRSKKINTRNAFGAVEDLSFGTNWHGIPTATADCRPNQYLMENQKSRIEGFLKSQPRTCRHEQDREYSQIILRDFS